MHVLGKELRHVGLRVREVEDDRAVAGRRRNAVSLRIERLEMRLAERIDDAQRPVLRMVRVHEVAHVAFAGFNRAQAAVIEGAVLVSRLHMLPPEKVDSEMAYLQIAIDKTAGPEEREAWGWLVEAVHRHRAHLPATLEKTPR